MLTDWRNDPIQKSFYSVAAVALVVLVLLINYWLVTGLWTSSAEPWLVQTMFGSVAVAALAIAAGLVRRVIAFLQLRSES